jgi:hypothetical protein
MLRKFVAPFNTPKTAQVNDLYRGLIGIPKLSDEWHWKGITSRQACAKLDALVVLRGSIAHRVSASKKVGKGDVNRGIEFLVRLAISSSNGVCAFVHGKTKKFPWDMYTPRVKSRRRRTKS